MSLHRKFICLLLAICTNACNTNEKKEDSQQVDKRKPSQEKKPKLKQAETDVDKKSTEAIDAEGSQTKWSFLASLRRSPNREIPRYTAWQALLERDRLLARRHQGGIAEGVLVEDGSDLYLVDESRGRGYLSIPIVIKSKEAPPKGPVRIEAWGAWHYNEKSWQFVAEKVVPIKSEEALTIREFRPRLAGAEKAPKKISSVSQNGGKGGAISFSVLRTPKQFGDGWIIADRPGAPPYARLILPGEKSSYGGQTQIAREEGWQLSRAKGYWLEVRPFRASKESLPILRAKTEPQLYKLPPKAKEKPSTLPPTQP